MLFHMSNIVYSVSVPLPLELRSFDIVNLSLLCYIVTYITVTTSQPQYYTAYLPAYLLYLTLGHCVFLPVCQHKISHAAFISPIFLRLQSCATLEKKTFSN